MSAPFADPDDLTLSGEDAVDHATAIIRGYCGWHIFPSVDEDVLRDANGGQILALPSKLVTAVAGVSVITADGSPQVLAAPSDYTWSASGDLRRTRGWWPTGLRCVEVQFTHGYVDVPDDVRALTISLAKRLPALMSPYKSQSAGPFSVTTMDSGAGFTFAELLVLNRYALNSVA